MKKLTHSLKAKVIAIIILILLSIFAILNAIGIYYVMYSGIYYGINTYYDTSIFRETANSLVDYVIHDYVDGDKEHFEGYFEEKYSPEKSNLRFSIAEADTPDIIEYSNCADDETIEYVGSFLIYGHITTLNVVNPTTAEDDFHDEYQLFNFMYSLRYAVIIFFAIAVILIIIDIIFLFYSAGHRQDSDKIHLTFFDKIPFDILIIVELLVLVLVLNLFSYHIFNIYDLFFYYLPDMNVLLVIMTILILLSIEAIVLITALSFAVRIKKGVLIKQLTITKIIKAIVKGLKLIGQSMLGFFRMLPYIWQGVVITLSIIFLNIFLIVAITAFWIYDWFFLIIWLIFNIIVFAGTCFALYQMNKLRNFGKSMASGDLETKLNTENMYFHFKEHGNNLNDISKGMNIAIEERMKSEHLKTELITNVSHDIKTPLTSIINYVDLIKQEDIDNENVKKYLDIVDKQSIRLKKLLEDLIEVSKASTGNITVENTPCELNVLLGQVVGEYKDKLEKEGLELIISAPEDPIIILGDGRHLWRIFDNLLNNICKYAQEKTRVYLTLEKQGNNAVIIFRNISEYPLNITSDELMERFIRGDKSRHTEGSGLGLSITKSLTSLQNGKMDIVVDGDLFKVILNFKIKEI